MFSDIEPIRQELGPAPRRIGFMGFGWGDRVFPVPENLRGMTPQYEPLLDTIYRQKDIWKGGQIVWGYVVMANNGLFFPGDNDLPGDVVYSLSATDKQAFERLPHIAEALYEKKISDKETSAYQEAERGVVEHLRLETDRAFGMPLPDSMSPGLNCHLSTFWAHRAHLPGKALGGKFVPLLVLAGKVHDVLIIPSKYWPSSLAAQWEQEVRRTAAEQEPIHEEDTPIVSEGGSTIYKYKPREASGFTLPDMSESNLEAISAHVEEHIGKIESVWHEIISDIVHIDVHVVPPRPERNYFTLVTSGMSDLPMSVRQGAEDFRFAELMICLPADWKLTEKDLDDERNYWPIRWLKTLARFPHEYETWLCHWHTIPNGDPPEPLAEGTQLAGFMLVPPMTTSTEFHSLLVPAVKNIHFHALIPLTSAEMEFKLKQGSDALMERLERAKITEVVNPTRKSVA